MDAGVGGKTGVNLVSGKNLIGSFHQPLAVLIDPAVLASLPDREYRAGLYEIIKAGVIRSEPLFRLLETQPAEVLRQSPEVVDWIIAESVRIKAEVVSSDERESGLRRVLNFGHTFGHALEAETHYTRFLHGEAVSWGMRAATRLAEALEMISQRQHRDYERSGRIRAHSRLPGRVSRVDLQVRADAGQEDDSEPDSFRSAGENRRGGRVRSDVPIATAAQNAIDRALTECRG